MIAEEFRVTLAPDERRDELDDLAASLAAPGQSLELRFEHARWLGIPHADSRASKMVSISIGVAGTVRADGSRDDLVAFADKALYAAKEAGRNRAVVATAELPAAARARPSDERPA